MRRVLHLISNLGPTAVGRAASRLIVQLPDPQRSAFVLGERFFDLSMAVGPVRDWFDVAAVRTLRRLVAESRPDLIHAWGPRAVRWTLAVPGVPFVASHLDTATDPLTSFRQRKARSVVAAADLISVPAVEPANPADRQPLIVCCGGFDHAAGLRFAVWAFDVISQVDTDLRLVFVGDGPMRTRLETMARELRQSPDVTRFVGRHRDLAPWLRQASFAWIAHTAGGASFAAEADAYDVPTIGFSTVCREIVPTNAPVALAARTHELHANQRPPSPPRRKPPTPEVVAALLVRLYDTV
jgi:hypothetical protein